ncbi:MAG: putative zinc protease YmfH [Firmicutes bacterium]|nr:putative zinc protease YmfH [Bacillota bacterium]MDI6707241.1 pitrilysin family protein [Bacillota bacterium]
MMDSIKEFRFSKIRETLHYTKLRNGLEVFILPKEGYSKQFAVFATNFGSIDTRFTIPGEDEATSVPDGIAHFLEHKLFEEEKGNVFDKFSKLGASANAYTNFTNTAYLFSSTSNFYQSLEVLVKFVQNPYFTDQNVEKEKGIIGQEIRMYDDNGEWRSFFNLLQGMYKNHPVRIDIAGDIESIKKIDKETLYKCYNNFYHPDNMVLFAAGDIDISRAVQVIEESLDSRVHERKSGIERHYPWEPAEVAKERVEQRLSVSQPLFNIGFKDNDVGYGGERMFVKDISTSILLEMIFGKGSNLYERMYREGLINATFSFDYTAEVDYCYTILGGESPDPDRLAELISHEISLINEADLTEEEFTLARNKLLGRYLNNFNSLEYVASNFVSYHFKGVNFLEFMDFIEAISIDTVRERFRAHLRPETMVLSVILPK